MIPGWPGDDATPSTRMIAQTRRVLEEYGSCEEVVFEESGHSPHLEQPERFREALQAHAEASEAR